MVRSQYLSTIMYACQSWLKQCERHNYGSKYSTSAGCILTSFSYGGPPHPPFYVELWTLAYKWGPDLTTLFTCTKREQL